MASAEMQNKVLVAFDFDHTIIDDNSDTHISILCPDGKIPDEIKDKYSNRGWTQYMGEIFKYLHGHGITETQIIQCMHELPLVEGMDELLKYLEKDIFDVIIISDSNSKFISYVLEHVELANVFQDVYTNPAHFDDNGCLNIDFYHKQDWCDLSTENLCKGRILEDHIKKNAEQTKYKTVIYVGDGTNDLCPALRLNEKDYICPRINFSLWKKMKKLGILDGEACDLDLKAKIREWNTGGELLKLVKDVEKSVTILN